MEASASIEIAKHTLVSCGLILAIGTITGLLAQKIKIPDVAVFLIAGMLIGPEALGLINIKADSALNQIILLFGASYILFDGGAFAGAPGDFRAQATQCFENLKAGLASVGAGFEHVVKVTNFFVDMSHLPVFFEVRDAFVNTKAPPASTAIQVGRLARDGALFEIEAVAVIPDKATKAVVKRGSAKTAKRSAKKPAKKKRR